MMRTVPNRTIRLCPYICVTYPYADACRNIFNTIKTSGQFFRKNIPLTLFERVRKGYERYYCVRGELETEPNCNILTPTLLAIAAFLSCSPGLLNRGPGGLGSSFCCDMVLIPASSLQLIWTSCRRGYIVNWRSPTSCERHICVDSQGYPLISSTGCTCYLHRCIAFLILTARRGANMQHMSWFFDVLLIFVVFGEKRDVIVWVIPPTCTLWK